MSNRIILHSDANSFFASVETAIAPKLKGKAVAVCGAVEERHGIVLAKSELAKKAGIKTGMTVKEAKKLCSELAVVTPHYSIYADYSDKLKEIYADFSDRIEPFGMDECWLDVSSAIKNYKDGKLAADMIRERVKKELGITVSIGVSFNKIFAKLGSDLKKPDGTTVIPHDSFRTQLYNLDVGTLFGVGRACKTALNKYGIYTIGQLADSDCVFLRKKLGKLGEQLWGFANGLDFSPVVTAAEAPPVKSIGHGTTPPKDLTSNEDVWMLILGLCQEIGEKLRRYHLRCKGVSISLRDQKLNITQYQQPLPFPTNNTRKIARSAFCLFKERGGLSVPLRSLSVTAINLEDADTPRQLNMLEDFVQSEKESALDSTIDTIRKRFGHSAIIPATLCNYNTTFSQSGLSLPTTQT